MKTTNLCALLDRLQQGRLGWLVYLLMGVFCVFSFAPFNQFWLMPLLLALFFTLLQKTDNWRQAASRATVFGLSIFLSGVSWVYVSMYVFGGMSMVVAALPTALLCVVLATGHPILGGLFRHFLPEKPFHKILLFAGLWSFIDLGRGWLFTGFPWLAVGYSQTPPSPLAGYAPIAGVYGVTFMTALFSACLATGSIKRPLPWISAVAVLLFGGWLQLTPWTKPYGQPISVALMQGNIEQSLKWKPEVYQTTLVRYLEMIRQNPAQLTVLPETAIPSFLDEIPQNYIQELKKLTLRQEGDLVFGVPISEGRRYWNGAVSLGKAPVQTYAKIHLVPFGEYAPFGFDWFLNIPMASFSSGPDEQPPMELQGQRVALNICYEDLFGHQLLSPLPKATLLVNMSNTAWFGRSLAQSQHLQIARMRALETGRPMLRSTNTGMTAVITPDGYVKDALPPFIEGVLKTTVQGYEGVTPYIKWGDSLIFFITALVILYTCKNPRFVITPSSPAQVSRKPPAS